MLKLSFKQTNAELMVRAAATVIFGTLRRSITPRVSISELTEQPQYGFTTSAILEPVGPKFVRITDLQDGKIDWDSVPFCKCDTPEKYTLCEDDILFARTGATTGKTYLVQQPWPAVFASYLIRLRPKPGVKAGYLYAFFQSDNYWVQIVAGKEGSAQPNVNGEKLSSLIIPDVNIELQDAIAEFLKCVRTRQDGESQELPELPPPLTEQRRIVGRIEELAAKIDEARILRQQSSEEAYALFSRSRANRFMALEHRFSNRPLSNLISMASGEGLTSRQMDGAAPFPVYGGGGLTGRYSQFLFEEPKIALGRVGARCGCVFVTERKSWITDNALYLTEISSDLYPPYLVHALSTLDIRQQANQAAQPVVSQKKINPLIIPVPPISEQQRVVGELDALQAEVDALARLQAETAAELDALLPSILDKAFKGEL